jgi:hypothetical protein
MIFYLKETLADILPINVNYLQMNIFILVRYLRLQLEKFKHFPNFAKCVDS